MSFNMQIFPELVRCTSLGNSCNPGWITSFYSLNWFLNM